MMFRRCLCVLALLLLPALGHAVEVHASLDRNTASLGDTVTLNLRVEGASSQVGVPDLSALSQDFDVLGTSQNRSLSIVNGVRHAQFTIGVALRPKHAGSLQVPALTVDGAQTAALTLQVTAPDPNTAADSQQDVFMEAQIAPAQVYVGQQLSYVVKLYYAVDISGSLDAPQVTGAQVTQVGDDLKYTTQRGGRQYRVLERRYAVVPQQAGHLAIPALRFDGEVSDPNDPNSFFGASTPVSASAPALAVEVQAVPPLSDSSATWLPARQLSLTLDGLPSSTTSLRVGQPINITMTLQATGIPAAALPALSLATLDGATVYPDKSVSSTRVDGPWLVGQRQQKFAIVPNRAGELTLPATTVTWWNVLTNHAEVAQVPARTLTILPAVGGSAAAPSAPPVAPSTAGATVTGVAAVQPSTATAIWRWLAIGSVGLWLLSLLTWWWWRRRPTRVVTPSARPRSLRQHKEAFLRAANGGDVAAQVRTLLAWARAERPGLQHLGELATALGDARQIAAVATLQRQHYAGATAIGNAPSLASVFQRGLIWRDTDVPNMDPYLAPLYPFDLKSD
ncbi:MAG: BatD family protein [Rhodanobacter sp.]